MRGLTPLEQLQREPVPMNRVSPRRGTSSGGYDQESPRTLAPGIVDTQARVPGTAYDGEIVRDRQPFYQRPRYVTPAQSWVNWTTAGPIEPTLHMSQDSLRTMQGNTRSRFPTVASPTGGMHTQPEPSGTQGRYTAVPQMVPGRQDRLAAGHYSSATYSQLTQPQGRGR